MDLFWFEEVWFFFEEVFGFRLFWKDVFFGNSFDFLFCCIVIFFELLDKVINFFVWLIKVLFNLLIIVLFLKLDFFILIFLFCFVFGNLFFLVKFGNWFVLFWFFVFFLILCLFFSCFRICDLLKVLYIVLSFLMVCLICLNFNKFVDLFNDVVIFCVWFELLIWFE